MAKRILQLVTYLVRRDQKSPRRQLFWKIPTRGFTLQQVLIMAMMNTARREEP